MQGKKYGGQDGVLRFCAQFFPPSFSRTHPPAPSVGGGEANCRPDVKKLRSHQVTLGGCAAWAAGVPTPCSPEKARGPNPSEVLHCRLPAWLSLCFACAPTHCKGGRAARYRLGLSGVALQYQSGSHTGIWAWPDPSGCREYPTSEVAHIHDLLRLWPPV